MIESETVSLPSGDVNGDGQADLVTVNPSSHSVSVRLGIGDGTFRPAVSYGTGPLPYSLIISDLNSDGKGELATVNYL